MLCELTIALSPEDENEAILKHRVSLIPLVIEASDSETGSAFSSPFDSSTSVTVVSSGSLL